MKDYKKFKWFYTSNGKLVVGGKSAVQNDELLKKIKKTGKEYLVMHTSHPGSPFCVIIEQIKKVTKKELEEASVFTGCFSRAWKQGKHKTEVHFFNCKQLYKIPKMKTGTWGVKGKVNKVEVELKLVLVKQKRVYRSVPEKSAKKKEVLLRFCPGKIDKEKMVDSIIEKLNEKKAKRDELLGALPAGGVSVC